MPRRTVKLLLVDPDGHLLLVHGRDPASGAEYWYPVGGGVEPGESVPQAAAREAWEETGIEFLPAGTPVGTRQATYVHAGRTVEVHEDWVHHAVPRFDPAPAALTDGERASITGFRWWTADELCATAETVFPPDLGARLRRVLDRGRPAAPLDLGG